MVYLFNKIIVKMNLVVLILLLSFFSSSVYSQVSISNEDRTAHPAAILDLFSTDKGFLLPRLSEEERDAIESLENTVEGVNAEFLMIANTDSKCVEIWVGGYWQEFWCYDPCEGVNFETCGDILCDSRDAQTYASVKIGDQCWMAQNLAYLPEVQSNSEHFTNSENQNPSYGVFGYDGNDVDEAKSYLHLGENVYETRGVLYNWWAAQSACPEGWKLPDHDDWTVLERYICNDEGNTNCETKFPFDESTIDGRGTNEGDLIRVSGNPSWCNSTCNDNYSFAALPSGSRVGSGAFFSLNTYAYWWSSTESESNAWSRSIYSEYSMFYRNMSQKVSAFSIRCIKDN